MSSLFHQSLCTAEPDEKAGPAERALEVLKEMTGGRGPDACIEAVGMEDHGEGPQYAYDRVKQALRMETDRGSALREAIMVCRKVRTIQAQNRRPRPLRVYS